MASQVAILGIITAFKAVDNVICGQGTDLLQRLANIQLIRLFNSLEGIIKADRDNGRIHREPYYRDANVAMDIYLGAQGTQVDTKELRLKLRQGRKRFSKRWSHLAGAIATLCLSLFQRRRIDRVCDYHFSGLSSANYLKARISKRQIIRP